MKLLILIFIISTLLLGCGVTRQVREDGYQRGDIRAGTEDNLEIYCSDDWRLISGALRAGIRLGTGRRSDICSVLEDVDQVKD